jgi:hypothetical protein
MPKPAFLKHLRQLDTKVVAIRPEVGGLEIPLQGPADQVR